MKSTLKLKEHEHENANIMLIVEEKEGRESKVGYISKRVAGRVKFKQRGS